MKRNLKKGFVLMALGVLFMAVALGLLVHNREEDRKAEKKLSRRKSIRK